MVVLGSSGRESPRCPDQRFRQPRQHERSGRSGTAERGCRSTQTTPRLPPFPEVIGRVGGHVAISRKSFLRPRGRDRSGEGVRLRAPKSTRFSAGAVAKARFGDGPGVVLTSRHWPTPRHSGLSAHRPENRKVRLSQPGSNTPRRRESPALGPEGHASWSPSAWGAISVEALLEQVKPTPSSVMWVNEPAPSSRSPAGACR